jgi:hypothetical protein
MIHLNARYVFHYYVHSDYSHEGSTPYSLMSFATTTLKTTNDKKGWTQWQLVMQLNMS